MSRESNLVVDKLDFKCCSCGITWSRFHQANVLCVDSSLGEGVHNFDLKKPISSE